MPLSSTEQRELDELEFEKLSTEKASVIAPQAAARPDNARQLLEQAGAIPRQQVRALPPGMPAGGPGGAGPLVDMGMEGGGAALGQLAGAFGGPLAPATIPAGGFIGGALGNAAGQLRRGGDFKLGQMLGAGVAGAVPGGSIAKAGAGVVAREVGKQALGNLAASAVQTGVDEGRLPTMGEAALSGGAGAAGTVLGKYMDAGTRAAAVTKKEIQNSVRDQTLAQARAAGYVIPPSKVNPGPVNNLLESIAGKAATMQEAAIRNQEITNSLARKEVGIPPDAPITMAALKQVRENAAAPYREIAAMKEQADKDLEALTKSKITADPHEYQVLMSDPATVREMASLKIKAAADVEALKTARFEAHENYNFYQRSGDPEALTKARAAEKLADSLDAKIEKAAEEVGRPDLARQLRDGRVQIAKAYQVEKALNLGDANVSAPILGRSLDKGVPLTGGLATISKMQQAYPQAMREGASVPASGVSQTKALASVALGAAGGPLAAAVPFVTGPTRSGLLSGLGQRVLATPRYPKIPDTLAQYARLSTESAGRNPLWQFLQEEYPANP